MKPLWSPTESARTAFRGTGIVAGALALFASFEILTYLRLCRGFLTWGAAASEETQTLPGDDLMENPDIVATRAVSIVVPPRPSVLTWAAGIRAGRRLHRRWLENLFGLNMHSVDVVLPRFRNVRAGDTQRLGTKGPGVRVSVVSPEDAFVLCSDDGDWVWAFSRSGRNLTHQSQPDSPSGIKAGVSVLGVYEIFLPTTSLFALLTWWTLVVPLVAVAVLAIGLPVIVTGDPKLVGSLTPSLPDDQRERFSVRARVAGFGVAPTFGDGLSRNAREIRRSS